MYKLKDIGRDQLNKIPIKHQAEITTQTAGALSLEKGYDLLKKITKNFTLDNAQARQADKLIYKLVVHYEKENKSDVKQITSEKQAIHIREEERLRVLRLIQLKTSLLKSA